LLGGGVPSVAGIDGLLGTVKSLAKVAGVDTSVLTNLLSTARSALAAALPGVDTSALQGVIGALESVLGVSGAPAFRVAPATPKATAAAPKATATAAKAFTAYRA